MPPRIRKHPDTPALTRGAVLVMVVLALNGLLMAPLDAAEHARAVREGRLLAPSSSTYIAARPVELVGGSSAPKTDELMYLGGNDGIGVYFDPEELATLRNPYADAVAVDRCHPVTDLAYRRGRLPSIAMTWLSLT